MKPSHSTTFFQKYRVELTKISSLNLSQSLEKSPTATAKKVNSSDVRILSKISSPQTSRKHSKQHQTHLDRLEAELTASHASLQELKAEVTAKKANCEAWENQIAQEKAERTLSEHIRAIREEISTAQRNHATTISHFKKKKEKLHLENLETAKKLQSIEGVMFSLQEKESSKDIAAQVTLLEREVDSIRSQISEVTKCMKEEENVENQSEEQFAKYLAYFQKLTFNRCLYQLERWTLSSKAVNDDDELTRQLNRLKDEEIKLNLKQKQLSALNDGICSLLEKINDLSRPK